MDQSGRKWDVLPPASLTKPLVVPDRILMGPGPSNCSPRVLHAMSRNILGHMHPETIKMMDEIKEGLRYVFQTKNTLTLALSASGNGGMEASLGNLLEPGETVLIAVNGIWGQRAADMAGRCGANVCTVETAIGQGFTLPELEAAIVRHRPVLVFITHGESSTGVLQPMEGLGDLCHKYNALLLVDTVASLGGVPFLTDAWNIDAVYTGTQKVLGAPPGMAPITFGERAVKKLLNRKTPVSVYYWDLTEVGKYWGCFDAPRIYHHTISASMVYGLREALAQICEEGLDALWARHARCMQRLHKGLTDAGYEHFVSDPKYRLMTVCTFKIPGPHWTRIISNAKETYSLEISGGLGPTMNKVMRIGVLGYNATEQNVDLVIRAMSCKNGKL